MPQSGIYKITNIVTDACYVGSSSDVQKRRYHHLHQLRHGIHHSRYMQRSFDVYGELTFEWTLLEEVTPNRQLLLERETFWIQELHPQYNSSPVSASRLGYKASPETIAKLKATLNSPAVQKKMKHKKHKVTKESRQKMSESAKRRDIKSRSIKAETKQKISITKKGNCHCSIETRNKLSQRIHSEESLIKQAESMKAYWAKRKQAQSQQDTEETP